MIISKNSQENIDGMQLTINALESITRSTDQDLELKHTKIELATLKEKTAKIVFLETVTHGMIVGEAIVTFKDNPDELKSYDMCKRKVSYKITFFKETISDYNLDEMYQLAKIMHSMSLGLPYSA